MIILLDRQKIYANILNDMSKRVQTSGEPYNSASYLIMDHLQGKHTFKEFL